jgi:hypothetical protein
MEKQKNYLKEQIYQSESIETAINLFLEISREEIMELKPYFKDFDFKELLKAGTLNTDNNPPLLDIFGLCFYKDKIIYQYFDEQWDSKQIQIEYRNQEETINLLKKLPLGQKLPISEGEVFYDKLIGRFTAILNENLLNILQKREEDIKAEEKKKFEIKLDNSITNILKDLDKNDDGDVDLIENDFNKLISKNQKSIMEIDKNYIHQFVKISNFIKTKKQNTQKIFESIRDTSSQEELEERVSLLKNQIHSYELLVFHSINMIGALVSEDLITFYEIYESFDKLGIFNSNWENEVSERLSSISDKLDNLMYSIYNMEQNIVSELSQLSYITQESFEDLNRSVTSQLREVESSINTNNLLTGIQAYQLYKINKNTKGLRS